MSESDTKTPQLMRLRPDFEAYTGLSYSTVYDLAARGELEMVKVGRATFIRMASYEDYIERNRFIPNRKIRGGKDEAA